MKNIDNLIGKPHMSEDMMEQLKNIHFEESSDERYVGVARVHHSFTYVEKDEKHLSGMLLQYENFYKELYLLISDKAFSYLKQKNIFGKINILTEHEDDYEKIVKVLLSTIKEIVKGSVIGKTDFSIILNKKENMEGCYTVVASGDLYMANRDNDYVIFIRPSVDLYKLGPDGNYLFERPLLAFDITGK